MQQQTFSCCSRLCRCVLLHTEWLSSVSEFPCVMRGGTRRGTTVVVCKVSGPPVLCYAYHWVLGPRCSATHTPRGYSRRDPIGTRFAMALFLVLGQHFRIVVIMRLRILATIATDPLFDIIRTWARTLQVHFSFGVKSPHTHPSRGLPFAQPPLGSLHWEPPALRAASSDSTRFGDFFKASCLSARSRTL